MLKNKVFDCESGNIRCFICVGKDNCNKFHFENDEKLDENTVVFNEENRTLTIKISKEIEDLDNKHKNF